MKDPRDYLRHPNGRGQIFDDAEVSISTLLEDSIALDSCQIRDAEVVESVIAENARVFGGKFFRSYAGKNVVVAGNPFVRESIISCRNITGKPSITRSVILGNAEVADEAILIGTTERPLLVKENALVYGNAELRGGFDIYGKMRINSGVWTRPPHYVDLGFCSITESKLGAMIDCRDRTFDYWFKHGPRLAERWGWKKEHIVSALLALRAIKQAQKS